MTTKNNKRIRELAEQAWLADSVEIDPNYKKYVGTERILKHLTGYNQKFAELIVRECCDIFVELRTRPADLAVKDVKQHFGVE